MPESFEALGSLILALLPGALYVWSIERFTGHWGIGLSDRLLRFVGASAVLHAVSAPLTYRIWACYFRTGLIRQFDSLPLVVWLTGLFYVGIPIVAGSVVGRAMQRRWRWASILTGPNPAPRAWDYLFSSRRRGWVRLRLKSGTWIGGVFVEREDGQKSYAAGYPELADLYLVNAVEVDPGSGEFRFDDSGHVMVRESSVLVRWEEIEYLEFIDA